MPSPKRVRSSSSTKPSPKRDGDIVGHLYKVGQRVYRRQNASAQMTFGKPRVGTIVDLNWKVQSNGKYPSYAVRFDNSSVVDKHVLQMRLHPIDQ